MLNAATESVNFALDQKRLRALIEVVDREYPEIPQILQLLNDLPKEISS
jgi:hypothetical protein